ncbi:MAG: hypothetical protein L0Z50_00590, partial [Verrucomicrobiales bacterium]|nr:hypothetical protein [Verrucomicrobiales bacterium]
MIGLLSWFAGVNPAGAAYQSRAVAQESTQGRASVIDFVQALHWLKIYAEKLERSHAGRIPEALQPLQQIQSDAAFLRQKWLAWPQRHPDRKPYYGSLSLD